MRPHEPDDDPSGQDEELDEEYGEWDDDTEDLEADDLSDYDREPL